MASAIERIDPAGLDDAVAGHRICRAIRDRRGDCLLADSSNALLVVLSHGLGEADAARLDQGEAAVIA